MTSEVDLLAPAKLAGELEARDLNNVEELLRHGPLERIQAWIVHYDRRRETDPKVRQGMLAAWIRGRAWPPKASQVETQAKPKGRFDEHIAWCKRNVPELNQALAVGAYEILRWQLGRVPTTVEVSTRVIGQHGEELARATA